MESPEIKETCDGIKMTLEEYNKYIKTLALAYTPVPNWTKEEEAYRRGYSQGFCAAIKEQAVLEDVQEVYDWRYGLEHSAPPFSFFQGMILHGLTEDDAHRFFINRLA